MGLLFERHAVAADSFEQGASVRTLLAEVIFERPAAGAYTLAATADVEIVYDDFKPVPVLTGVSLATDTHWRPQVVANLVDGTAIETVPGTGRYTHHTIVEGRIKITVTGGGTGTGNFMVLFR